jgi:hypothetical protein
MGIGRQPYIQVGRRYRLILVGLVTGISLIVAIFVLTAQVTRSSDRSVSPTTTPSKRETTAAPHSTTDTRNEVLARFKLIFRIRDQAIRTRNPLLLEDIYTVDCPCLKGDQQLIRQLRQQGLVWRGVKVSLDVQEVERVNDRLWTASAVVTTSPFNIVTESGVVVRKVPEGRELSRFALSKPVGRSDWLLGQASVIEERD